MLLQVEQRVEACCCGWSRELRGMQVEEMYREFAGAVFAPGTAIYRAGRSVLAGGMYSGELLFRKQCLDLAPAAVFLHAMAPR